MDRVTQAFSHGFDFNVFSPEAMKRNELTSDVLTHLSHVYTTLIGGLLVAALGVVAHLYTGLGGIITSLAALGVMFWLATDNSRPVGSPSRLAKFAGFCFLKGMSLGGLVSLVLFVDPSILVTALLGTVTVFVCFSLATLIAKRRTMLYLGGILSSALGWLMILSLVNMFFWSDTLLSIQLYGGLFVFCGYVLYDTELIVSKVKAGNKDYVWHAVELFIDFVAIFVRLVIILLRNSQSSKKKERR